MLTYSFQQPGGKGNLRGLNRGTNLCLEKGKDESGERMAKRARKNAKKRLMEQTKWGT